MPTDRVHCLLEQVKVWVVRGVGSLSRLSSRIVDVLDEYFRVVTVACGLVCRRRATGAAPEQKGCNAYGSGALPL